jgi:hypothetical protein
MYKITYVKKVGVSWTFAFEPDQLSNNGNCIKKRHSLSYYATIAARSLRCMMPQTTYHICVVDLPAVWYCVRNCGKQIGEVVPPLPFA